MLHEPTKNCQIDPQSPTPPESPLPRSAQTLTVPLFKTGDPAERALQACLELTLLRFQSTEVEARRGDHEGIHLLRTSTRRLRSELRAFRDMVEPDWIEHLEVELKWFAGILGEVRDIDVLSSRLKKALSSLDPADAASMSPLFTDLTARHARGLCAVREALQSERYRDLLAELQGAVEHPDANDEASVPCWIALPPLADAAWRRLRKSARGLHPGDPDEKFHEVRKNAKRARYIAEMIAPILGRARGKIARTFIRRTTRVQDALGEHQDAIIAAREIAAVLEKHPEDAALTETGQRLIEAQNDQAKEARRAFFRVWHKLDHKKLRRWMKVSSKVKA